MRPIAALVAGLAATYVAAGASSAAPTSRIVFSANRLAQWYGEIYRVTPSSEHVNLTKSPAPDLAPSVSPDGQWVAFLSGRGGEWAFYVVGSDGRGLHRVSPAIFALVPNDNLQAQIAWAPNSRDLAAEVAGPRSAIYFGTRTGMRRALTWNAAFNSWTPALGWSQDGHLLAYSTANSSVNVTNAAGKRVWSVTGSIGPSAWSSTGRLAVATNSRSIAVYDSGGRHVTSVEGTSPTWSPHGTLLASVSTYAVQIRRNGGGTPIIRRPARNANALQWINATTLRFQGPNGWVGLDVAHDRVSPLVSADTPYNSVVSPSGRVLAEQPATHGATLVLGATTLAVGPCSTDDGDFSHLAFMPRNLGVIYQANCSVPAADIYTVNPDGSGLRQVTDTPADELEPSLSADGESIVYVRQTSAGKCEGCAQTLWRVSVTGGTPQQLTSHEDTDAAPFDENPTWSPDGSQIAFQNSGANVPARLLTIPANGGPTRDLRAKGGAVPAWGPKLIAYADWSIAHLVIKTLDPATGGVQTVATGGKVDADAVAWSSTGRLAYLYDDKIAIAGSQTKPLDLSAYLRPHARVAGLAWSPDGTRFAFAATDADGTGEIYTIGIDGKGLRQVTRNLGALYTIGYQSTISWR